MNSGVYYFPNMWFDFLLSQPIKKSNMGRGDKRTAKGKRFRGSFGNSRLHKVRKPEGVSAITEVKKEKAPKKVKEPKAEKPATKKPAAKKTGKKKEE